MMEEDFAVLVSTASRPRPEIVGILNETVISSSSASLSRSLLSWEPRSSFLVMVCGPGRHASPLAFSMSSASTFRAARDGDAPRANLASINSPALMITRRASVRGLHGPAHGIVSIHSAMTLCEQAGEVHSHGRPISRTEPPHSRTDASFPFAIGV
jgi:hypothetical protein